MRVSEHPQCTALQFAILRRLDQEKQVRIIDVRNFLVAFGFDTCRSNVTHSVNRMANYGWTKKPGRGLAGITPAGRKQIKLARQFYR